jgi:hypothetical protein
MPACSSLGESLLLYGTSARGQRRAPCSFSGRAERATTCCCRGKLWQSLRQAWQTLFHPNKYVCLPRSDKGNTVLARGSYSWPLHCLQVY